MKPSFLFLLSSSLISVASANAGTICDGSYSIRAGSSNGKLIITSAPGENDPTKIIGTVNYENTRDEWITGTCMMQNSISAKFNFFRK